MKLVTMIQAGLLALLAIYGAMAAADNPETAPMACVEGGACDL